MSCPPPSFCGYACIMHATAQNKARARSQASNAAKATDQTDHEEPKKNNPQNQKEKQKGLGANPGHTQSQNSQSLFKLPFSISGKIGA